MVDVPNRATLRGFHLSIADIGDQMHLCQPLLSFKGDTLYCAYRLEWRDDPGTLTVADPSEASALGTLLPPTCRLSIASGEGVVAVGRGLVQAAADAKVDLLVPEVSFVPIDDSNCWIGVATPALYTKLKARLVKDALAAFDEELRKAVRDDCLSERGNAALFLIRRCGPRRNKDLAIPQLVGARQNGELALYRRLLVRFEIEFGEEERVLDEQVKSYLKEVPAQTEDTTRGIGARAGTPPVAASWRWRLATASAVALVVVGLLALWVVGRESVTETAIVDGESGFVVVEQAYFLVTGPETDEPNGSDSLEAAETERQRLAVEAAAAAEAERQRAVAARRRAASWHLGHVVSDGCDGCPNMVVIPAGDFMMGSPTSENGRRDDEGPQHRVTVSSFALGVTEVTFDEWEACVRGGGCEGYHPDDRGWGRGSRPVINVSWEDAQAYVSWLSAETGAAYRLPSESEWEYAARADTMTPFHTGATISRDQANYDLTRVRTTRAEEEGFELNQFGLYDMHGNVWEWVEDCWHDSYRDGPSDGTAWTVGGNCGRRVLRGGSWLSNLRDLRSANRFWSAVRDRLSGTGFRVARTLE